MSFEWNIFLLIADGVIWFRLKLENIPIIVGTSRDYNSIIKINGKDSISVDWILYLTHIFFILNLLIYLTHVFFFFLFHLSILELFLFHVILVFQINQLISDVIIIFIHIFLIQKNDIVIILIHGFLRTGVRPGIVILLLILWFMFFTVVVKKFFYILSWNILINGIFVTIL